ncbi:hypothetical protein ACGFNU_41960 [Spirillospora sp. NPDC048911]|uniref:hypothetical protein n=1 Tax=Spirillospora sp. NPDC048911 TaxID=3364527 RepID=UPI0037213416
MSRAEQAAAQLQRVKQLAEDHGPALRQAFTVLLEGALIGPAGQRLLTALAEHHRDVRSNFYAAFDAVKDLAAEAEGGPPRIGEPYISGPPRGGLRSGDVRSGSPDALHRLGVELDRAGRAWQDAGQTLANILGGLGLSTAPAQNIVRAGGWVSQQRQDVVRRRDELLKADQQQLLQAAYGTVRGLSQALGQADSSALDKAWNDYAHRYLPGLWEGTKDLGLAGLASNPFTAPAYAMANPRSWMQRGPIGQFKGLIQGAQHPVSFAKAMINWDLWKRDPIRAYGQTVPSIVIGALTLGTGSGSGAAGRLSTALRRTGKTKPETPATDTGGAVRALDEAADQAGKTAPLGKQNTRAPSPPAISRPTPDPGPPDMKVAGNKPKVANGGADAGDRKGERNGAPLPEASPKEAPLQSPQELMTIARSGLSLQEIFDDLGPVTTGRVIGEVARQDRVKLKAGEGQRAYMMRRFGELDVPREKLADVMMHASMQAWGEAGWFKLPSGEIAVVPGKDFVPDTFIIRDDGSIFTCKTKRWFDPETHEWRLRYLD